MEISARTERDWVKICMAELCRKAGFADCHNLVQRDLEFVSESIETKTGVLISLSTIKRLLNGQFSRQPQIATLNAISLFLGYQNWQDFKQANGREIPGEKLVEQKTALTHTNAHEFSFSRYILIGGLLAISVIGLLAFLKSGKTKAGNFDKAQFSVHRTTASDLPNTVVFNYNIDKVIADSFFIQQSWDKDRRVRIDKKNHTLTDIYYEPGYHVAKLIANDQVIKTMDVSIPTDRWFFYARERKPASLPVYITTTGIKNGSLTTNKEDVVNSGIDIGKEQLFLQVYFPTQIEHSSDNYILHCRARINEVKNNSCPFLMCEVFCQRNFMYFKSTPKGCASEIKAQFGENILNGKIVDLSGLGTGVEEWQDIEITVKNKNVTITINGKQALSTQYAESSGMITGLGFISNGLPEVDFVNLKKLDGTLIYNNDFDK
ncbi:MAG TPA: family 16 glycoside hydrolase [Chitinophagaceae bacterium]|nr:family 16 glycoside hydrolase [Chitinophagaceae bacterium]